MTKHEQAAKMRAEGASIEDIMAHSGWAKPYAYTMVWRGKNADKFREYGRKPSAVVCARLNKRKLRQMKNRHRVLFDAKPQTYIENRKELHERSRRVLSMIKCGATYSEAAVAQGLSREAVAGICYRAGLKAPMTEQKNVRRLQKLCKYHRGASLQ